MFWILYTIAVVLLLIDAAVILKLEGTDELTRGFFITYVFCMFVPFGNLFIAFVCTMIVAGTLYERWKIQDWLDKPLINKDKE